MRFPRLLFLIYLATCVLSFGIRGGFERLWLWNTNRLAVVAANRGVTGINLLVPGSKHAQGDFNEFIRFIGNRPNAPNVLDPPTLTPPVEETARRLQDMGLNGPYYQDLILPGSSDWPDMMDKLDANYKTAIKVMDRSKSEDQLLLERLDAAVRGVTVTRQADADKYFKEWLQGRATTENISITWKTKKIRLAGQDFLVLDIAGTVRASASDKEGWARLGQWFKNKQKVYKDDKSDQKRQNHLGSLSRYKKSLRVQKGASSCS
ncbi:hypothetical protein BJY00DRAFT_310437 [Aspergillus carlsbadensis]|nr:hypothetical protein BJY00DRAFT_310437 [Aspergillus carlsbadensis]